MEFISNEDIFNLRSDEFPVVIPYSVHGVDFQEIQEKNLIRFRKENFVGTEGLHPNSSKHI